jgi:hypothetical protein
MYYRLWLLLLSLAAIVACQGPQLTQSPVEVATQRPATTVFSTKHPQVTATPATLVTARPENLVETKSPVTEAPLTMVEPSVTRGLVTPVPTSSPPSIRPPEQRAITELAHYLSIAPEDIRVVRVTREEMPIQNLGCPTGEPDPEITLPAFVIGSEIVLAVADHYYVYRVGGGRVILCQEWRE